MKKITIILTFVLSIVFLFNACDKMEDIHGKYLEGDIIYAPKPLQTQTFAGKNRIKVKYYLINAVNINKCIVEWNNGENSQTVEISPNTPIDSVEFLINNLEEKSYLFKIYTIDKNGNRSVKEQVTGSAYDTKYIAGLTNRPIIGIEGGGTVDSVVVTWGTPPQGNTKVEYSYTREDGEIVSETITPDIDRVVIRGWKSESDLTYKSYYIPEETAIDTFASAEASEVLPVYIEFEGIKISKSKWEIVEFSTEEPAEGAPNGLASAAIDDDLGTFWHTQWNGGNPGYPHHFIFDMKDMVKINKIKAFRRQGDGRGQTEFQILTSLDSVNYTLQGTFGYDPALDSMTYNIGSLPMARYVKYVATKGQNFFAFLAELDIYGQVAEKIDKSDWEAIDYSSEEAGGEGAINGYVTAAFDDDINTFWHTAWSTSSPDYPHYITMDMKKTVRMFAMDFARRQGNSGGHSKFQILTSSDGENFVDQGTFDFDRTSDAFQMYSLAFIPEARYFKFVALEGPNNYTFLGEMNVYGQVLE
ncbi:DUF4998 domain-containing protein [Maribellus sp. YY47]|uniref:DUF4998 domain-containing protein n=1 Tax=Maribellus sp. YY47 TaxID=2929486 RepID=UPI002001C152|nr:DUF4998 domain-containing protein [Maribellus sp. YY47]MCK3685430.1 discoidin domain-containing protein [Maribellus sp. YY47]